MIIDQVYENAIKKLIADGKIRQISSELLKKDNNSDRVLFVLDICQKYNFIPPMLEQKKADQLSTHYRNLGNMCFLKKENYNAWQYYNLSLLYAPVKSENYAIALSNRSAIFCTIKKYQECLQDIELCLSLQHPEKIKAKLLKRKELCQEALRRNQNVEQNSGDLDIVAFKGEKSQQYLSASTKLDVVYNKDMGRHVIAKEDIRVGEVLVEEEPYFSLILKTQILFACNYCLARKLHLIPCESCCCALYCSEECRNTAWKEYHAVECPLLATLLDMEFTKIELLSLRTAIKARTDHTNWESLFKTIEDAESNINTEHHGHVEVDGKWIYDSKKYASIHTLSSNIEKRSVSDIFQKSVTAAVLLKYLTDKTDFMNADTEEDRDKIRKCVAGLLLLHGMTSPTNMHGISSNIDSGNGKFVTDVNIASAPYAYHSLLNHSCAPNVVRLTELGTSTMKLLALRPIKKGMQIFDNYGSHHALEDRMERQNNLKFQYKFTCMCEACVNNWPTYMTMRRKKIPPKIMKKKINLLNANVLEKLERGDRETAAKSFIKLCDLCEELENFAPCVDLCDCQEALKQCLVILEGLIPYGHDLSIDWKMNLQQHNN